MARNYKIARLNKKIKLREAVDRLEVSQTALSSWESERSTPSIEALEKMADLYGVTTDYLLGRTTTSFLQNEPLTSLQLSFMSGQPVWSLAHGWMLVQTELKQFLLSIGTAISFADAGNVYASSDTTALNRFLSKSLPKSELCQNKEIWLEPISTDMHLREELRGWYRIAGEYAENQNGNRFSLSSYEAKWLAFINSPFNLPHE